MSENSNRTNLASLAQTGDITTWEKWRLEVVDLDGTRIDKVLASRVPEERPLKNDETNPS